MPLFPALGIPTRHCANLSAAVYTVLYDRHAKRVHDGLELSHSTAGDFDEPDHMANAVGITWGGELVAYDANRLRRLLPAKARLDVLVHYRRPSASCSNRWSAAYTRSIRTMVIRFPSTSYSTR